MHRFLMGSLTLLSMAAGMAHAGRVDFEVVDVEGRPVAGAVVSLTAASAAVGAEAATGGPTAKATTDDRGNASLEHVAPGTYRAHAWHSRLRPAITLPLQGVTVSDGKPASVRFVIALLPVAP